MESRNLRVAWRPIADLAPYENNPRTHTPDQIGRLAASIVEFGWTNPVLIDGDNGIIAGHGRVMAAQRLGYQKVPCIELGGLTLAQRRAYVIADNRLAEDAGWDDALLSLELGELRLGGFDLALTGFGDLRASPELDDANHQVNTGAGSLAMRFGIPPFTVMNAREGWWQERKRAWLALGIQSELGRGSAKASPGGSLMPGVNPKTGKVVRTDSRARPITG